MNKALISVVIPIYNVENFLAECLDSVLSQSYTNIEILAINDGSTDNSGAVLDEYAQKDSRIRAIHIPNGGVSNARNTGIEKANGDFIYFLDGDDVIETFTFELLMNEISDCDMIQPAYDRFFVDGKIINDGFVDKTLTTLDERLGGYFLGEIKESCCNKLYRLDRIKEMRFNTDLPVAEDSVFIHDFIKKANKIKLISNVTYHYRIHGDSCMHSQIQEKHFLPMKLREEYLHECDGNKELYKKWVSYEAHLCFYLIRLIVTNNEEKFYDRIHELREKVITKKRYILFSPYFSSRFKIGVLMLWLSPKLFYKLYK